MWEHNYSEDTGICIMRCYTRVSLVVQKVESLPAVQEGLGSIPGQKDLLGKGMATHSGTLAWKTTWTEEPGGLQSVRLQRAGHS